MIAVDITRSFFDENVEGIGETITMKRPVE